MGRGLAVTRPSPDSCGARFAIAAMHAVELKWLILKSPQMIPFIACEILPCQDVCELVFGVDIFDLDFGIQINSIELRIKRDSVSSGNMSHCWTPAFHNYFDYSFIVLKHIQ